MVISEFNTDGDVTGPLHQGESIKRFVEKLKSENADWFDGFSMYQFRDRGRLGLEIEDPNNASVGIPQPILKDYKDILKDPFSAGFERSRGSNSSCNVTLGKR